MDIAVDLYHVFSRQGEVPDIRCYQCSETYLIRVRSPSKFVGVNEYHNIRLYTCSPKFLTRHTQLLPLVLCFKSCIKEPGLTLSQRVCRSSWPPRSQNIRRDERMSILATTQSRREHSNGLSDRGTDINFFTYHSALQLR